jgi:hypothetical protein
VTTEASMKSRIAVFVVVLLGFVPRE